MKLNVIIDEQSIPVNILDEVVISSHKYFEKMDADMAKGWQMSRTWIESPNNVQRCQIIADRLLNAIEKENQPSIGMMTAYILNRLEGVKAVDIDTSGDILLTEFIF